MQLQHHHQRDELRGLTVATFFAQIFKFLLFPQFAFLFENVVRKEICFAFETPPLDIECSITD